MQCCESREHHTRPKRQHTQLAYELTLCVRSLIYTQSEYLPCSQHQCILYSSAGVVASLFVLILSRVDTRPLIIVNDLVITVALTVTVICILSYFCGIFFVNAYVV